MSIKDEQHIIHVGAVKSANFPMWCFIDMKQKDFECQENLNKLYIHS